MNWRSNYKLPFLSFIVFFVLMFFLVGEQLPSLPLYVLGPATDHQGKIHILDLASGDALHRPIAYLIFALISWSLLRFLSWPVVWIITGSLWTFDQVFVRPGEPGKYLSFILDLTLSPEKIIPSIIAFLGWGVLAMAPYFLYRWIDKKWGGKSIKKSILTLFLINLFLFGYFALQIFVLHHSYRNLYQNTGQQGNSLDTTPRLPPNTCPEKLVKVEGRPIVAYLNGQALDVGAAEQKWVETNCPGVLQKP